MTRVLALYKKIAEMQGLFEFFCSRSKQTSLLPSISEDRRSITEKVPEGSQVETASHGIKFSPEIPKLRTTTSKSPGPISPSLSKSAKEFQAKFP